MEITHIIPFEMKLPRTAPLAYTSLTKEQSDEEIGKSIENMKAGSVYSADVAKVEIHRDYGI